MSYLQNLTWFSEMHKYDERTISLLIELSNPQYNARKLQSLYSIVQMEPYVLQSVIKNLASEGVVYIKNDRQGNVIVGLVDKKDVLPSIVVSHRIDGRTVNSIVIEASPKNPNPIVKDFIYKSTAKKFSPDKVDAAIEAGYLRWESNGEVHEIEINDTKLIPQ